MTKPLSNDGKPSHEMLQEALQGGKLDQGLIEMMPQPKDVGSSSPTNSYKVIKRVSESPKQVDKDVEMKSVKKDRETDSNNSDDKRSSKKEETIKEELKKDGEEQ